MNWMRVADMYIGCFYNQPLLISASCNGLMVATKNGMYCTRIHYVFCGEALPALQSAMYLLKTEDLWALIVPPGFNPTIHARTFYFGSLEALYPVIFHSIWYFRESGTYEGCIIQVLSWITLGNENNTPTDPRLRARYWLMTLNLLCEFRVSLGECHDYHGSMTKRLSRMPVLCKKSHSQSPCLRGQRSISLGLKMGHQN